MKYILRIGILVCFIHIFFACRNQNKNETSSLTIVCDSSFYNKIYWNGYLISSKDTLTLNHKNTKFDTLTNIVTIKWDSLMNGVYHFETVSAFQQKNSTTITLQHDTIIHISNGYKYEFVNSISKEELLRADTVAFAFQAHGCSFRIQGYTLIHNGDKYRLKGSIFRIHEATGFNLIDKNVSSEIVNDLYKIQTRCQEFPLHQRWCTMSYQFMLLSQGKVFYFDDEYSVSSDIYDSFFDKYIIEKNNNR